MTIALPVLGAAEVAKMAAIAARMRSDADGEALAATRALTRQLGKHGLRPEELVERAFQPVGASDPKPVAADYKHQRLAIRLLPLGIWSEREVDFLRSRARWRHTPSPAQQDWLTALAERAESRA